MNYKEIKDKKQEKVNNLINECKVFFAFSNEQFAENKTTLREGEKYVAIGGGGYMPNGNTNMFLDGMAEIDKWAKEEVMKSKNEENQILYELRNHECFYTNDWSDALYALPGISEEQVKKVFLKHYDREVVEL